MIIKRKNFIKRFVNKIIIPKLEKELPEEDYEMNMLEKAFEILKKGGY